MVSDSSTIREKTARLEALRRKLEQFVENGGDLKSPEASPLDVEFIQAFNEVSKEFGYEVLKPIKGK